MPKSKSNTIYIEYGGSIYKFINLKIEPNDGSFYVTLLRAGENMESIEYDSKGFSPVKIKHKKPRKKLKKISYHSSGCVRYHNTGIRASYFEPIARISCTNMFAVWSIPSIKQLDLAEVNSVQDKDYLISINHQDSRIEFHLALAPWNTVVKENHFSIRYQDLFSFVIIPTNPSVMMPDGLNNHFMTAVPEGLYKHQTIREDAALVEYHQKINQTSHHDLIIYSPNQEGIYKIIPSVPMFRAPDVEISFFDKDFYYEVISKKNNVIKFKVKDKHGHTIKSGVPIESIFLSAEL